MKDMIQKKHDKNMQQIQMDKEVAGVQVGDRIAKHYSSLPKDLQEKYVSVATRQEVFRRMRLTRARDAKKRHEHPGLLWLCKSTNSIAHVISLLVRVDPRDEWKVPAEYSSGKVKVPEKEILRQKVYWQVCAIDVDSSTAVRFVCSVDLES